MSWRVAVRSKPGASLFDPSLVPRSGRSGSTSARLPRRADTAPRAHRPTRNGRECTVSVEQGSIAMSAPGVHRNAVWCRQSAPGLHRNAVSAVQTVSARLAPQCSERGRGSEGRRIPVLRPASQWQCVRCSPTCGAACYRPVPLVGRLASREERQRGLQRAARDGDARAAIRKERLPLACSTQAKSSQVKCGFTGETCRVVECVRVDLA